MDNDLKKKAIIEFSITFIVVLLIFVLSMIKTNAYNRAKHHAVYSGPTLFSSEDAPTDDVSV